MANIILCWGAIAQEEESGAHEGQHNAELQRQEDSGHGAGGAGLDGGQVEKRLSGAAEGGQELFVGAALVQKFIIDFVLHLGEFVPFVVLQGQAKNPEQPREKQEEQEKSKEFFFVMRTIGRPEALKFRPYGRLESLSSYSGRELVREKQVELWIADNLGMVVEEFSQLRV